jgi:hypothetical protein
MGATRSRSVSPSLGKADAEALSKGGAKKASVVVVNLEPAAAPMVAAPAQDAAKLVEAGMREKQLRRQLEQMQQSLREAEDRLKKSGQSDEGSSKKLAETKAKLDVTVKREAKATAELKVTQDELKVAKAAAAEATAAAAAAMTKQREDKTKLAEALKLQAKLEADVKAAQQRFETVKAASAKEAEKAAVMRAKLVAEEQELLAQAAAREAELARQLSTVKQQKQQAQQSLHGCTCCARGNGGFGRVLLVDLDWEHSGCVCARFVFKFVRLRCVRVQY